MSWSSICRKRAKEFIDSNRNLGTGLSVFVAVSTTAYVAYKHISERQQRIAQANNEASANHRTKEFFFERTQETCTSTLISFLPSFKERLFNLIEPPTLDQLRNAMSQSKQEKLAIWDQRKYLTFARTMTSIYGFCLINVLSRVQVHLLGRYLLAESVAKKENDFDRLNTISLSDGTRLEFLSSANYFLSEGLSRLSERVITACTIVLARWPLEKRIDLDDLKQIFSSVRDVVEGQESEGVRFLSSLLLPPESSLVKPSPLSDLEQHSKLTRLLNETRDVLEDATFERVLIDCLNTEFAELVSHLRGGFPSSTNSLSSQNGLPIATIFPLLDKQTEAVLDQENNDYLHQLSSSEILSGFVHELFLN